MTYPYWDSASSPRADISEKELDTTRREAVLWKSQSSFDWEWQRVTFRRKIERHSRKIVGEAIASSLSEGVDEWHFIDLDKITKRNSFLHFWQECDYLGKGHCNLWRMRLTCLRSTETRSRDDLCADVDVKYYDGNADFSREWYLRAGTTFLQIFDFWNHLTYLQFCGCFSTSVIQIRIRIAENVISSVIVLVPRFRNYKRSVESNIRTTEIILIAIDYSIDEMKLKIINHNFIVLVCGWLMFFDSFWICDVEKFFKNINFRGKTIFYARYLNNWKWKLIE